MSKDPYSSVAGFYDRLFESFNRGLRVYGLRMFIPPRGGAVLDVGCGTGKHLEMYQRFSCKLYGIEKSQAMLAVARARLGESADLRLADASTMPYQYETFDLVICMLALHEMDQEMRLSVVREIIRVVKRDGRILFIDFHAGRPRAIKGWFSKLSMTVIEFAAGRRHFRNYRYFISIGGLPHLIQAGELTVVKKKIVGEDTLALYLLRVEGSLEAI